MDKMKLAEQGYIKKEMPEFGVGDTLKILTRIPEGDKVRLHPFEGVVIAKKRSGIQEYPTHSCYRAEQTHSVRGVSSDQSGHDERQPFAG